MKIRKIAYIIFFALFLPNTIFASCETPGDTLSEYLQRDTNGERLGYKVSAQIDKLETADNYYQSAWDMSVLVTGYQIKSIKTIGNTAVAVVLFINSWEMLDKFDQKDVKDEEVEIHLKKINNCWKVGTPFFMPRIYPERLLQHYSSLVNEDKKRQARNDILLEHEEVVEEISRYILFIKSQKDKCKGNSNSRKR